jgi:hypothetical protein
MQGIAVRLPMTWFFYRRVFNGLRALNFNSLFVVNYFHSFILSFAFYSYQRTVGVCETWKYTSILQQSSFTYCENSISHIRLGWQACKVRDGTHPKCHETQSLCAPDSWKFSCSRGQTQLQEEIRMHATSCLSVLTDCTSVYVHMQWKKSLHFHNAKHFLCVMTILRKQNRR